MNQMVCVDFDGVLHSYISPFTLIPQDPPVDGAIEFLRELLNSEYIVGIFSTRNVDEGGPDAIKDWLIKHGMTRTELAKIEFPVDKTKAILYIDDRAYRFEGTFPTLEEIRSIKPWNDSIRKSTKSMLDNAKILMNNGVSLKDIVRILKDNAN